MGNKKGHHLVPCSYLKGFGLVPDGRDTDVYVFDKINQATWKNKIKEILRKNHFYSIVENGSYNTAVETLLGEIEAEYPKILAKLTNNDCLDEDETSLFWLFVSLQMFRTERGRGLIGEAFGISERNKLVGAMLSFSPSLADILKKRFDSFLYAAPDGCSFVTCDNPVFWRILHSEKPDPGGYAPFELLFPLSANRLLIMRNKGVYPNPDNLPFVPCGNIDSAFVERVNSEICLKGAFRYAVAPDAATIEKIRTYKSQSTPVVGKYNRVIFYRPID